MVSTLARSWLYTSQIVQGVRGDASWRLKDLDCRKCWASLMGSGADWCPLEKRLCRRVAKALHAVPLAHVARGALAFTAVLACV